MKNTRHSKNDMILFYKQQSIQEENFPSHALALRDLIFNDKTDIPELCKPQEKKKKLSNCFVIEMKTDDYNIKPRSASTFKPSDSRNNGKNSNNVNEEKEKSLIRNYYENNNAKENPDKITCQNCFNNAKRKYSNSNELFLCRENSISIVNLNLVEYKRNDKVVNLNNDLSYLLNFKNVNNNDNNDKVITKGRKFGEIPFSSSKEPRFYISYYRIIIFFKIFILS